MALQSFGAVALKTIRLDGKFCPLPYVQCWRSKSESARLLSVDEGRKRVIGVMASILATRKLAQNDGGKPVPATMRAIADAVRWAEAIMKEIDERWPVK
jgi:hypothetical protein